MANCFLITALLFFFSIPVEITMARQVFAHFMMGFAYPLDVPYFETQIKRAMDVGIDGFALNVGIDDWQPDRVKQALQAAQNVGSNKFFMFISFDMSSLPFDRNQLGRFSFAQEHPNYLKINGRPMFSTFGGEGQDGFWQDWKSSTGFNPYFCPSWPNYPTRDIFQQHPVADCIFTWNAWPTAGSGPGAHFDTTGDQQIIQSARATNKQYMAPLSPWFYTHVWGQGFNKYWLYSSERLLPERWQQLIDLKPDFIEIITWNDYTESTYFCSIGKDLPTGIDGTDHQVNWPEPMKHDGWLDLSKHYIQWYKTGNRPAVTQDQFYWWYRVHPKGNVNGPAPTNQNDAEDCLVVHSIVKSTKPNGRQYKMIVDLNGQKTTYSINQLEQTECIPFPQQMGYVTLSLQGPDNNIWWAEGKNIPMRPNGDNFNAYVNSHQFGSP